LHAFGWNHRFGFHLRDVLAQVIAVIGLISKYGLGFLTFEQGLGSNAA